MKTIIFSAIAALILQTSIYNLPLSPTNGSATTFEVYKGKKLLLVNIATASMRKGQIAALQHLQQIYQDSLVVIAFPSNSFGNEPLNDDSIQQYCETNFGSTFLVAKKTMVTGNDAEPVFQWLADDAENGVAAQEVQNDFQKFLIDENGKLVGIYAPEMNPLDKRIRNAIEAVYQD